MEALKRLISYLPLNVQQTIKRLRCGWQIRNGRFAVAEQRDAEFPRLAEWIRSGDWVIDLGANLGTYTARLSELVGASGRVISVEPVPETFELLAANVARLPIRNITLLNLAASDHMSLTGMSVPMMANGLENRYMAHLASQSTDFSVLCLPIDHLGIQHPIRLIKIDVEGHELQALNGMRVLLERNKPVLIVEGRSPEVADFLKLLGYSFHDAVGSPNRVYTCPSERISEDG